MLISSHLISLLSRRRRRRRQVAKYILVAGGFNLDEAQLIELHL